MTDKYVEYSRGKKSGKRVEGEENQAPDSKLFYRNTGNPERDKSCGGSSDEETTSSSLVPIPDSLRKMREDFKKTINEFGDHSEVESSYTVCSVLERPVEKFGNPLDKFRQMYSLKNEASVALKMNSANLMLDDILKSKNFKMNPNEHFQSEYFTEEETVPKTPRETETSTIESSVSVVNKCKNVGTNHPQPPDIPSHLCPMHGNALQSLCSCPKTLPTDTRLLNRDIERKKSLAEKIQNLNIKYKIYSVYKMMQRTNPFLKSRKESDDIKVSQGIPGSLFREDPLLEDPPVCKCQAINHSGNHHPQRMTFDLVEFSEGKKATEDERHCTCSNQRRCTCPEVVCQCVYRESTHQIREYPSETSVHHHHHHGRPSTQERVTQTKFSHDNSSMPGIKREDSGLSSLSSGEKPARKQYKKIHKEYKKNREACKTQKTIERTDIYYFDHGNSAYYQTTDSHPIRYTECLVERTDEYATLFWQEVFGSIGIGMAFIISFFLQFYRFLFTSIIRPLTVGLLQIFSDYFFKPLLTISFNGIIQPCLILAYNTATSFRDLCLPLSQIFGFFTKEVANVFRSCRLVEFHREKQSSCCCENKV